MIGDDNGFWNGNRDVPAFTRLAYGSQTTTAAFVRYGVIDSTVDKIFDNPTKVANESLGVEVANSTLIAVDPVTKRPFTEITGNLSFTDKVVSASLGRYGAGRSLGLSYSDFRSNFAVVIDENNIWRSGGFDLDTGFMTSGVIIDENLYNTLQPDKPVITNGIFG